MSKLIGTAPNQVPTNADLGQLAYQDKINNAAFFGQLSSSQTVSSGTWTKVAINNEILDTHSAYDTSSYRFTVPTEGTYLFTAGLEFGSFPSSKICQITIRKNGSSYPGSTHRQYNPSEGDIKFNESILLPNLIAGDYVEFWVYHNTGVNETLNQNETVFGGVKVA